MSKYLSNTLQAVTPYTPGEQPQGQKYIKLNTNESPYPPSPAVLDAVSRAEVEKLRLYSDPACADLLRAAAKHFGLQPDQIMPGNGSDENLFFALRAFCDESHPLAYADITYGCYGVWCGLLHIPSDIVPLKEDFTLDPADYYGRNETIVIANPNAPTGLALPRGAIEGILKANPNNVVIVDEAYVDFGGESCVPLIDQYENLLVIQTFSKSRQLAGFGERLDHQQVLVLVDEGHAAFPAKVHIGLVHNDHVVGVGFQDALYGTAGQGQTRGGIGVGNDDGLVSAVVIGGVQREILFQGNDIAGDVEQPAPDAVAAVGDVGIGQRVALIAERPEREEEVLVAAVAGHDLIRLQAKVLCRGPEQVGTGGVGVEAELFHLGPAHGVQHRRGGRVGALVGVELDVFLALRLLPRGVGGDSLQCIGKIFTHFSASSSAS